MSARTLPGIFKVEYIPASEIIIYPKQIPSPGSTISAIGNFVALPTVGLCNCSITDERTDAGLVFTTTINGTIKECSEFGQEQQYRLTELFHCYRITDVYKYKYLVGIDSKPFPEIHFSPAIDSETTGIRAIPFSIVWKSTLPHLELRAL